MADDAVNFIGSGVSRQGKGVDFSHSIFRAATLLEAQRRTKAAADKGEKLINLDDFQIDNKNLLPAYATQVGNVVQRAANDYTDIKNRVGDPYRARNIWEQGKGQYQTEINQLMSGNDATRAAINSDESKYEVPNKVALIQAANNRNITGEEWAKLNDPANGIIATPAFGYGAVLNPRVDFSSIIQKYNKNGIPDWDNAKTKTMQGGQVFGVAKVNPSDKDVELASNEILSDDTNFNAWKRKIAPEFTKTLDPTVQAALKSDNPADKIPAQQSAVRTWVKSQMEGGVVTRDWKEEKVTEADKKYYNQQAGKFNVPVNFQEEYIDEKGQGSTRPVTQTFPYLRSYSTKPINVTNTEKVYDATTGHLLKDAPTTFNIIPSGTVVHTVQYKSGKKENVLAVMGTMVDTQQKDFVATKEKLWRDNMANSIGKAAADLTELTDSTGAPSKDASKFVPSDEQVVSELRRTGKKALDKTVLVPLEYAKGALEGVGINTSIDEKATKDLMGNKESKTEASLVPRQTKNGKTGLFDATTHKFVKWQ